MKQCHANPLLPFFPFHALSRDDKTAAVLDFFYIRENCGNIKLWVLREPLIKPKICAVTTAKLRKCQNREGIVRFNGVNTKIGNRKTLLWTKVAPFDFLTWQDVRRRTKLTYREEKGHSLTIKKKTLQRFGPFSLAIDVEERVRSTYATVSRPQTHIFCFWLSLTPIPPSVYSS